jgi:hypothetical protein
MISLLGRIFGNYYALKEFLQLYLKPKKTKKTGIIKRF